MMASVVYSQRIHLAIVFYMGFLALIFISFVIYFVERDSNPKFNSLSSSMWWAVITLCTIGTHLIYDHLIDNTKLNKLCPQSKAMVIWSQRRRRANFWLVSVHS